MPDTRSYSALVGIVVPGRFGASGTEDDSTIAIRERWPLAKVEVAAIGGGGEAVGARLAGALGMVRAPKPNQIAAAADRLLLWVGPDRWLAVAPLRRDLFCALRAEWPATDATVVDLSSARTCVRLAGAKARAVLAKGCTLDFHPRARPGGYCAQSTMFGIQALVHVVATGETFDLYVPRGLAVSFWQALGDAAAEFGYAVLAPGA